jgi:hypothetical protein
MSACIARSRAETGKPPAASLAGQQVSFDRFREEYNQVRPHQALDQATPASRYRPSPRPYPKEPLEPSYDGEHAVRRVRSNGEIKWGGDLVFISQALVGEWVGIAETEAGDWMVRFFDYELGLIGRRGGKLRPFGPPRPGGVAQTGEQTEKTVNHVS